MHSDTKLRNFVARINPSLVYFAFVIGACVASVFQPGA